MNIQQTETENGAKAYSSTGNYCLDLFSKIGAVRHDLEQAEYYFMLALNEDFEKALRILFYARDIRGGQGERKVFRHLLLKLVETYPKQSKKILHLIPEYGRWDDLLVLENTKLWPTALTIIKNQLTKDLKSESVSLLGKWLPSLNASSKDSKRIGLKIATHMKWSPKIYRKNLVSLRTKIRIVEQKMCSNQWDSIAYENVPSKASLMYRNAFDKHDGKRYKEYLADVKAGKKKINAGAVYPYEIVGAILDLTGIETADAMWNSLPNYMTEEFQGVVVADTSGSMNGSPLNVCISLAIYIAERNKSNVWKNKFITFSENPEFQNIVGYNLTERVCNLSKSSWGYNTDLIKVFQEILKCAVAHDIPESEMIDKIIIVSDMQFDSCCSNNDRTNFEFIKESYESFGYSVPQLIFWNVNSYSNTPVTIHDTGTCLVSGCSPSILKTVLATKTISPMKIMNDSLYCPRYDPVGKVLRSPVTVLSHRPLTP
jgi:hypothetical protein